MMSLKRNLATKYNFKMAASEVEIWVSLESNFVRIARILETRTSMSGKTDYSLATSEDKK